MTLAVIEHPKLPDFGYVPNRDRINEVMAHNRSEGTRRTYASLWATWENWADERGLPTLPAEAEHIADFLVNRAETCTKGTINTLKAAIAAMHVDNNLLDPTKHKGVKKVIAGLNREDTKPQRQATALTKEVQAAIIATAHIPRPLPGGRPKKNGLRTLRLESQGQANARAAMDIALVSVMRDGLLRRSEAAALTWADVQFEADGSGLITIRKSKTDQTGQGQVQFIGPDAVKALKNLKETKPFHSGPEDSVIGLTGHTISRRLGEAARYAGLDGNFSGHSPRVGMAVDLTTAGFELPALMAVGRWSTSQMVARYTRNQAASKSAVAQYYSR